MKASSLVSCIMLSILVIFLLSTAAQATEYREVKAEDILKQIKNGEEVNYTDCRIVGELNVSKMKLETVPNPYYYKFVNEGLDKEFTSDIGLSENLSVIESNITIKNSTFEDSFNFSNVQFNGSSNFKGSNFNSDSNFSGANFSSSANFEGANFNSYAKFNGANFNDNAEFSNADFEGVNFNSSNSDVDFIVTDFSYANFNSYTHFLDANFNNSNDAYLTFTSFDNANFSEATFFDNANFNSTTTSFDNANFNSATFFNNANFTSYADFNNVHFNIHDNDVNTISFLGVHFNDVAIFLNVNFDSDSDFWGPETPDNIITDGKSCEIFKEYYERVTRYEDADTILYNYRKSCQDNKDITLLSKCSDFISWITCGYGLRPLRIFWSGAIIVGFFACLYWRGPGIYRSSDADTKKSEVSFWDGLYFSINTFTTLGSADWYPKDNFRKWVTLEGLCGWTILGIFMATLANILIR